MHLIEIAEKRGQVLAGRVAAPMLEHAQKEALALAPEVRADVRAGAEEMLARPKDAALRRAV